MQFIQPFSRSFYNTLEEYLTEHTIDDMAHRLLDYALGTNPPGDPGTLGATGLQMPKRRLHLGAVLERYAHSKLSDAQRCVGLKRTAIQRSRHMLTKFMEEIGGKLAERWLATFLTPTYVFWLGGWGILVYGYGWTNFWNGFKSYSNPTKILLVIAGLAVITLSALVAQQFQPLVLRLLEGYWPNWKAILKAREFFLNRLNQKYNDTYSQWGPLN